MSGKSAKGGRVRPGRKTGAGKPAAKRKAAAAKRPALPRTRGRSPAPRPVAARPGWRAGLVILALAAAVLVVALLVVQPWKGTKAPPAPPAPVAKPAQPPADDKAGESHLPRSMFEDPAAPAAPPAPAVQPAPSPQSAIPAPPQQTAMVVPPKIAAPPPAAGGAWLRNAAPMPADRTRPWLAIVIDDVGVAKAPLPALLKLPSPVTFAVMGYAQDMTGFEEEARRQGQELLIHVPMQPMGKQDAGPNALVAGLGADEIRRRLDWQLSRHTGFVGINNHMGSRFTSDPAGMGIVMGALRDRGLAFLDSRTAASTVGESTARTAGVPTTRRDVFLDNDIDSRDIGAQLARAEAEARRTGTAVAIGHPHPETVAALARFIPEARARGVVFAPVSAIILRRAGTAKTDVNATKSAAPPQPPG